MNVDMKNNKALDVWAVHFLLAKWSLKRLEQCWNAGTMFRAEQGPCEPSKGFVSKSGERTRERARESQREP